MFLELARVVDARPRRLARTAGTLFGPDRPHIGSPPYFSRQTTPQIGRSGNRAGSAGSVVSHCRNWRTATAAGRSQAATGCQAGGGDRRRRSSGQQARFPAGHCIEGEPGDRMYGISCGAVGPRGRLGPELVLTATGRRCRFRGDLKAEREVSHLPEKVDSCRRPCSAACTTSRRAGPAETGLRPAYRPSSPCCRTRRRSGPARAGRRRSPCARRRARGNRRPRWAD